MLEITNKSNQTFRSLFRDLRAYKDLLWILAWRDYKVRYAQSALGVLWAFLQPIITLLIFVLVFGKVAKIDTGDIPYPIYAQCGMVAWSYFAFLLAQAGNSLIGAEGMIKKIYFPRLIIPLSKALVGLIDFAISFVLLLCLMVYYQFLPTANIVFLPLFLMIAIVAGLSVGIWVSALTVRFRDFKHLLPFMVQIGMYITPIAYPASQIPSKYQLIYHLNPMAGVVEGFRWCLVGGASPTIYFYVSLVLIVLLLWSSIFYFRKVETVVADIL